MKPVFYTAHAETVILERRLELQWISKTIQFPEWTSADPLGHGVERRFRRIEECGGRFLRVVCVETAEEIRIISAFLDRDARNPDEAGH